MRLTRFIPLLPLAVALTALAASTFVVPSRVELVDPNYPYEALYGGDVFLDFAVSGDGTPRDIRVRHAAPPFTSPAKRALEQWKFSLPPVEQGHPAERDERRIALVWQFRMAQTMQQQEIVRTYEPNLFGDEQNRPPVPTTIVEAAQPVQVVNEGTALLAVLVDTNGKVKVVRALNRAGALGDAATVAVRRWKFAVARVDGEPAEGELLVAITFPRPVIVGPPPPR